MLLLFLQLYLGCFIFSVAFINATFDISKWAIADRGFIAVVGFAFSFVCASVYLIEAD